MHRVKGYISCAKVLNDSSRFFLGRCRGIVAHDTQCIVGHNSVTQPHDRGKSSHNYSSWPIICLSTAEETTTTDAFEGKNVVIGTSHLSVVRSIKPLARS
jgi:hypothetical protein